MVARTGGGARQGRALARRGRATSVRLFGYAGVGKTTLASALAEIAPGETAFAAFTGKAALVMRSKGASAPRRFMR